MVRGQWYALVICMLIVLILFRCDVGVYVRSMYMSGRRVCEIIVYVNILVTRAIGCGVEG